MDNQQLSELIGLIYDVAHDPSLWPRLLNFLFKNTESFLVEEGDKDTAQRAVRTDSAANESLVALSSRSDAPRIGTHLSREFTFEGNALNDLLKSHCERALTHSFRLNEALEERSAMEDLLARLPLGMLIVDSDGKVLTFNSKLDRFLSAGSGISIENGELKARSATDTAKLKQMIRVVADGEQRASKAFTLSDLDTAPISLLLFPFRSGTNPPTVHNSRVVVLLASPELYVEIPEDLLMSLYDLTAAEARLVSSLTKDKNLDSIAEQFGISKHTVRSQLKSVFEKTGTHRQAELVRQIITGPAMFAATTKQTSDNANPKSLLRKPRNPPKSESKLGQTLRLPDRRLLGYAEYGIPDGRPVILMHAVIGSRLQRHPDETIVEKCRIRLIVPDRPGVGLSDRKEDITLLNWVDDVECLVDHLGIDRFSVIGFSGGSAFALATAHRLQHRIDRLVLISGIAPFDSIWELGDTYPPYRLIWALGRYAPSLLGMLVRMARVVPKSSQMDFDAPKDMKRPMMYGTRPIEPDILKRIDEDARECYRQGDLHILRELILYANDWNFDLADIQVPVQLWIGELDRIIPQMIQRLVDTLPDCQRNDVSGEGHYLIYSKWEDILRSAM